MPTSRALDPVRDLLATALLLVATVLGAAWLPAVWLEENVVDQEGFLAIAQPLGSDPELQRELSDSAVEEVLGNERVPGWLADSIRPTLEEQAARLTGTGGYQAVWDEAMVQLHGALFTPGGSPVDVDLAPLADEMLTAVEDAVPFVSVPRPEDLTITLFTVPDVPLLSRAEVLDPWAHRLGPIALVLAALALLLGAHRRILLVLAGLGGIAAGLGDWFLAQRIEQIVPDQIDQAAVLGSIVQAFQERFAAEVGPSAVILLGVGALLAAAGLVLLGLRHRS
ncbi:hypothetical protein V1260_12990 [Brachybacterium sp. J144]|uniref:hypothetical protein n=1 Tax=unclassified Brachybacterium TaxID=2623841 RepID=UPI002E787349|nr:MULTISPECIES: hypothetical protein [unclassified Brachybacterium]MEE1618968.1 hypothetical protein [Brachybacterium sp. J153]MEE1651699.1 hypothetical protein [Brachybacterium sp. J144]